MTKTTPILPVLLLGATLLLFPGCDSRKASVFHAEELPHFVQVDEGFYRGGQPSQEGLRWLAKRGVKTIVSLRTPHKEQAAERALAEQLGLRWVNLPITSGWRPTEEQIQQFLALAQDPASRPLFIHCQHGKNRTGMMGAIYRMGHDGWSLQQAYEEARRLGMGFYNFSDLKQCALRR